MGCFHQIRNLFLQNRIISIGSSNFYWLGVEAEWMSVWGLADGWMGVWVCGSAHAWLHAHAHKYTHMLNMVNMIPMKLAIFQFLYMYLLTSMCMQCMWGYPPPPDLGAQITKNTISLEQIEIIQFCLKICDVKNPFLFRLDVVYRRGCPIINSVFYFWTQKVHIIHSCQVPGKTFPVFTLDLLRPCLDWALKWFLTS